MEPSSGVQDYAGWFFGVGAMLAGLLTWLGRAQKPRRDDQAVATLRGSVLMDSHAMDPLRRDLQDLKQAMREMTAAVLAESDADRARLRGENAERERMTRLLRELEDKKGN